MCTGRGCSIVIFHCIFIFPWHIMVETDLTIGSQGGHLSPHTAYWCFCCFHMLPRVCGGRVWQQYLSLILLAPKPSSIPCSPENDSFRFHSYCQERHHFSFSLCSSDLATPCPWGKLLQSQAWIITTEPKQGQYLLLSENPL